MPSSLLTMGWGEASGLPPNRRRCSRNSATSSSVTMRLFRISINGADPGTTNDETIKVLGEGTFDVHGFVRLLDQAGYRGPIGLQCFNLKGAPRDNLGGSMATGRRWRPSRALKRSSSWHGRRGADLSILRSHGSPARANCDPYHSARDESLKAFGLLRVGAETKHAPCSEAASEDC